MNQALPPEDIPADSVHAAISKRNAVAGKRGTIVPRTGVFWGTHPPRYHSPLLVGGSDLGRTKLLATEVPGWQENHAHPLEQTSPTERGGATVDVRLQDFHLSLPSLLWSGSSIDLQAKGSFSHQTAVRAVRDVDIAFVRIKAVSQTLDPLLDALKSAFEALGEISEPFAKALLLAVPRQRAAQVHTQRHVGLDAVARLSSFLRLPRAHILRMAAVPESTFYAWQNKPDAEVRIRSVKRLLRLQATVAMLSEALGEDGARSWLESGVPDRLQLLRGNDRAFEHVMSEAEAQLSQQTRPGARRRLSEADYGEHGRGFSGEHL